MTAMLDLLLAFLLDVVFYGICYPVGWVMLRVLTFGRYPPPVALSPAREFIGSIPLIAGLIGVVVAFA
jgi:hypothetical protein